MNSRIGRKEVRSTGEMRYDPATTARSTAFTPIGFLKQTSGSARHSPVLLYVLRFFNSQRAPETQHGVDV
jgi:hypothetical protein